MAKSKFQDVWMKQWSEIRKVHHDTNAATCITCSKTFSLSNMGVQAIKSHLKSSIHLKAALVVKNQRKIDAVFPSITQKSTSDQALPSTDAETSTSSSDQASSTKSLSTSDRSRATPDVPLYVKDGVMQAEILWCLKTVYSSMSYRSNEEISKLLAKMFPDSDIAKQFSLGRDKVAYSITYGIAPVFKEMLLSEILKANEYVICIDEALNRIAQQSQMDIIVRFWDSNLNKVSVRYLNSVFLNRCSASDLMSGLKEGLFQLPLCKLLQLSLDGPTVNQKLLRDFKSEIAQNPDDPRFVDVGTCGLHIVSGAFQTGHKESGWNINGFLRNIYNMFKDCPSRRASFKDVTGCNLFPLKFCVVRWIENADVAARAIEIYPHLVKWFKEVNVSTQLYETIQSQLHNQFLIAELHFFKSVALQIEPFLTQFQSPKPMFPFLYEHLDRLIKDLMKRFVKPEVMNSLTSFRKLSAVDISLKSDALLFQPDVGFGANKALKNLQQRQKNQFYSDCKMFLSALVRKFLERCPLHFPIVRAASALSPSCIQTSKAACLARMQILLENLVEANRVSEEIADKAKQQYSNLLEDIVFGEKVNAYEANSKRLDDFYAEAIGENSDMKDLWTVTKMILILSHGNSSVESSFSVNKNFLVVNLHNQSLIAQRMVFDHLNACGGPLNVAITPELKKSVGLARQRYRNALEMKKTTSHESYEKDKRKRHAEELMEELRCKKMAVLANAKAEENAINKKMAETLKIMKS